MKSNWNFSCVFATNIYIVPEIRGDIGKIIRLLWKIQGSIVIFYFGTLIAYIIIRK